MMEEKKGEILHIFIIGFHHKKGCQIEFSYPEIECLPEEWRNLPSLAMPDGAHNYENDAVYFHLPNLNNKHNTIFGISCFQQIPIEKVKKRTTDMTRGTIQKAICILSTLPLFGYIQIKMELVTAAFFDEGDFSNVSLLKDAFHHLNDCLSNSYSQHLFDGLCVRDLVLKFRHKILLLFKLLLLEKKVIFFHSPVKPLCCALLSLISLHPGLIENGLFESFSTRKACFSSETKSCTLEENDKGCTVTTDNIVELLAPYENIEVNEGDGQPQHFATNKLNKIEIDGQKLQKIREDNMGSTKLDGSGEDTINDSFIENFFDELKGVEDVNLECPNISTDLDLFPDVATNINLDANYIRNLNLENFGLPLSIFIEGNLCLPYVSISYLDFLTNSDIRGFHGGATNLLFKQKKQLFDVLVELDTSKIETSCPELRRQLFLTIEDLRFGERLVRGIIDSSACEIDCSKNYGNDNWIRMQFSLYMLSLLRTSLLEDGSKELEHFNVHFLNAWKNTRNYKIWINQGHKAILELNPGHPFAGNLSVSDMRLRFSQAMTNTESGRRINQAVTSTGRAVGGAITQAKGALSHWWTNFKTPESKSTKPVGDI